MLKLKYINVRSENSRRENMESMLTNLKLESIDIERFDAIDKGSILVKKYSKGSYSAGTVACYISHINCISQELNNDKGLLILEDDVILSKKFFEIYQSLEKTEYDIIFLAVTFGQNIENYKKIAALSDETCLVNLKNFGYAGTYGYFIPPNKKNKIHSKLSVGITDNGIMLPIDLQYADLTHTGEINAAVLSPYYLELDTTSSISTRSENLNSQNILDILTNSLYIEIDFQKYIKQTSKSLNIDQKKLLSQGLIKCIEEPLSNIVFN